MLHRNRNNGIGLSSTSRRHLPCCTAWNRRDTALADLADIDIHPQAAALIDTLADCRHPRAGRLTVRLAESHDADELAMRRGEVLNLLALSFGPAEAQRRLQAVQ